MSLGADTGLTELLITAVRMQEHVGRCNYHTFHPLAGLDVSFLST